MKQELIYTLQQISIVAQELVNNLNKQINKNQIITLTGDLGAGKTTLVKQLLKNCGVRDEIVSPTFTYVNCYKNDQGQKIYHFDLYRIANLNQFLELGFDEYLHEPNSIVLIEWPGVIVEILQELPVLAIEIEHLSDTQRRIIFGFQVRI